MSAPRIISTFLPPAPAEGVADAAILMVFDTLVNEKNLVVGFTVGVMDGPDLEGVRVSEIGRRVIERMGEHHQANYPGGPVAVFGVASRYGAPERVRKVLAQAPPDSAVLLVCADDKVYDAAFPALGVDYQSLTATGRH
jgi:hypothetical protein